MSLQRLPELACIVPTHNRPHFLRRLLTFWLESSVQGTTIIADSSTGAARQENEKLVRDFGSKLPLEYMHFELGVIDKVAAAVHRVATEFVVISADDDFALPATVSECLQFLNAHPDYVCAQGMIVSVKPSKSRSRLKRGYDLSSPSAARRFQQMAELWFSTFYGVYRTQSLQECFRVALTGPKYEEARIYPEYMLSQMTVLLGKVKVFPKIYAAWQVHEGNEGRNVPAVQDLARAEKHYRHFRAVLSEQLQQYGDLDPQRCEELIDRNFATLLEDDATSVIVRQNFIAKLWASIDREIRRSLIRIRLQAQSLSPRHNLWQDPAWRLAHRLIQTYPQGMSESQFVLGEHTSCKTA